MEIQKACDTNIHVCLPLFFIVGSCRVRWEFKRHATRIVIFVYVVGFVGVRWEFKRHATIIFIFV